MVYNVLHQHEVQMMSTKSDVVYELMKFFIENTTAPCVIHYNQVVPPMLQNDLERFKDCMNICFHRQGMFDVQSGYFHLNKV